MSPLTRFRDALWWGAGQGLVLGWLVILLSVPYNFLGLVMRREVAWEFLRQVMSPSCVSEKRRSLGQKARRPAKSAE